MTKKLVFKTIKTPLSQEIPKIKWSKFIWHLVPVSSKEAANIEIKKIQNEHHNATHNCYVFRVGIQTNKDLFGMQHIESKYIKSSDDWEPGWTAAYPIKKVLEWEKLNNILLVVTRYFGWTKLWIWGLIHAYTEVSKAVIEQSKIKNNIIEKWINKIIKISFDYKKSPVVMTFIKKNKLEIINQNYWDDIINLEISVNITFLDTVKEKLNILLVTKQ